jgi:carboxymethylenebutenolidase
MLNKTQWMRRFVVAVVLLTPTMMVAEETAKDGTIQSKDVVYGKSGGRDLVGYLAVPKKAASENSGKHPAILMIHEWWGLNADIKAKADQFAELGYVALAVDMYGGKSTADPAVARKLAGAVRADMKPAFANLEAAIAFLKAEKNVDAERMASIGWCFGGGWSYQIAKNNLGVKASVIYYGFFNPEDDLKKMRAEIIGHFAEKDRAIKVDNVKAFQAKLKTLGGDHQIYIYPNTTHGFASRKGANPNYDAKAAEQAQQRTLEFLKKHL